MTDAQRDAFNRMVEVAEMMSNVCFNMKQNEALPTRTRDDLDRLQTQWDKARNRYFELEAEAAKAKSSARKSRGAVRQKAGVQ